MSHLISTPSQHVAAGSIIACASSELPQSSSPTSQKSIDLSASPSIKVLLQKLGVIDKNGIIVDEEKLPPLPTLKSLDHSMIDDVLNKSVTFEIGEKKFQASLSDILKHVYFRTPRIIPNMEVIGGFVRKILLESPDFLMQILKTLTVLPSDELQPYVDNLIKKSKARDLPDIDVRIFSAIINRDILCNFTQSVVDYLSVCVQSEPYLVQKNAFSKFNVVYDDKNKFSIATVKPLDSFEFELLFVAELKRNHLFAHDSLRLSILPYLLGSGPLALESDYKTPWQPIIDLLTQSIHIPEPESVDIFGFPVLMSWFTRGYSAANRDEVNKLEKKVSQLSQYHMGIPGQIIGLLSTTLRNHHQDDRLAAIALTINALMHLEISPIDSTAIWQQMRAKFWEGMDLSKYPLLKMVDEALHLHQIPFPAVSAAIALYGQGESSMEIPGAGYYLSPSCEAPEAVNHINDYVQISPVIDWLFPFLIGQSPFHPSEHFDKGSELISSKNRSQRFLGFMLLLNCGDKKADPLLLQEFIDILNFTPEKDRPALIARMEKSTAFTTIIEKFKAKYNAKRSESGQLLAWITILAEQSETSTIAHALWMRYRNKFSSKGRTKMDVIIVNALLPHELEKALRLIELGSQGTKKIQLEKTVAMLTSILPYVAQLDEIQFATQIPRFVDLLLVVLSDKKKIDGHAFANVLAGFVNRLITTGYTSQAEELLDMISKNPGIPSGHPPLYQCRLRLVDLKQESLKPFLNAWKKLQALGECPKEHQPLYNKVHLTLTTQLLENIETVQEGYKQLRILAEQSQPDTTLSPLGKRDVTQLIDTDCSLIAAMLVRDVYLKHLKPKTLLSLRKRLFDRFLREGEYNEAYHQWKEIHTVAPQTTKAFLDAMINGKSEQKQLSGALRLIRKEVSDSELSPLEKLSYFITIFHKMKSLKLLGNIVSYAMETPACQPERVNVLKLFNTEVKQRKKFEKPFIDQIRPQLPAIIDTLKKNHHPKLVEGTAKDLNTLGLPLSDFELICSQVNSYIDAKNHKKALKWIRKASAQEELFLQWLPGLLLRYRELSPAHEAELYQVYHTSIRSLPQHSDFIEHVEEITSGKELAVTTATQLLNLYPPKTSNSWDRVIKDCDPVEFPFVWSSFYTWLETQPEISSALKTTVFAAIERLSDLTPSPVSVLFKTLESSDSPLGRLCTSESELFEFRGKLLLSYASQVETPQKLSALYDAMTTGLDLDKHIPAYRDLTLRLIAIFVHRNKQTFTSYACKIFSPLISNLLVPHPHCYCDAVSQTLITLLDLVVQDTEMTESNSLILLVYASSVLRETFGDTIPTLEIADKLSRSNASLALEECNEYLVAIPEDSPKKKKVWGQYLSRWLVVNDDWESMSEVNQALEYYTENISKLEYKSSEYISCSNIAFDLILKFLDQPQTMIKYCGLVEAYFTTLFEGRSVVTAEHEMPLHPYTSPVFTCTDSCDEKDCEFFFDRMTTLLSKLLDRDSLEPSQESYVHHFITKNLWELCSRFPGKREELVGLLDRFYFRYPPADNMFFPAHVAFAGKLLLHAIKQGIYDHHESEMAEAMLFLEMKICFVEGKRVEDQAAILERVIDRTLAFNTPSTLVRAILILQGTQAIIIKNNLESIQRIYKKLTDAISFDPFYIFNRSTLFEWVRLGLMHKDTIIGFSKEEEALSTVSHLSENLFLKVFGIFQKPSLFEGKPSFSRLALLEWLGKFLLLSRQHGAYWDRRGVDRYFRLVEMIIPEVAKVYPNMKPSQQAHISEIYTRVIIGEGFHQTSKLTNKQKRYRSEIMREWLLKIICTPDHCRTQLEFSQRLHVFEKTYKDYRKVDIRLKSC